MNIPKAIKSNQDLIAQPWLQPFPDLIKSVQLGIEALKATQESRRLWGDTGVPTLPGETEGG